MSSNSNIQTTGFRIYPPSTYVNIGYPNPVNTYISNTGPLLITVTGTIDSNITGPFVATLTGPISLTGTSNVNVINTVPVTGTVSLTNTSFNFLNGYLPFANWNTVAVDANVRPKVTVASASNLWWQFETDLGNNYIWSETGSNYSTVRNQYRQDAVMSVGTTSGSYVYRQFRRWVRFLPTASGLVTSVVNFNGYQSNIIKRFGTFFRDSSTNTPVGFYFENDGTNLSVNYNWYTPTGSVTQNKVINTNWNVDKMDGTGISGNNVVNNMSSYFAWGIDFTSTRPGGIRFSIAGANGNGVCHRVNTAQTPDLTWDTSGLPYRYELFVTGASSSSTGTMNTDSCSVSYDSPPVTSLFVTGGDTTADGTINPGTVTLSSSWKPVLGFGLRSGQPYIQNSIKIVDYQITVTSTQNSNVAYKFVYNPTLSGTGTAYTTGKISQYYTYTTETYTSGSGMLLFNGNLSQTVGGVGGLSIGDNISIGSDISGNADVIVLLARTISGSPVICAAVNWEELV